MKSFYVVLLITTMHDGNNTSTGSIVRFLILLMIVFVLDLDLTVKEGEEIVDRGDSEGKSAAKELNSRVF
jgi:hypothetical protein